MFDNFEQYNSLSVRPLSCKNAAPPSLQKLGNHPTRVGALLQSLTQERRNATSWHLVQTFYTGRCVTILSLASVVFSVVCLYRVKLNILRNYPVYLTKTWVFAFSPISLTPNVVGANHCILDNFHLQSSSFCCTSFHYAMKLLDSSPVQVTDETNRNWNNYSSVSTGPAGLFEAGIAGLRTGHGFCNGNLEGVCKFHEVYGYGGLFISSGVILVKYVAVSWEICSDVPAGRQVSYRRKDMLGEHCRVSDCAARPPTLLCRCWQCEPVFNHCGRADNETVTAYS